MSDWTHWIRGIIKVAVVLGTILAFGILASYCELECRSDCENPQEYSIEHYSVRERLESAEGAVEAARDELESALDCVDADDKDRCIENALDALVNVGE